MSLLIFSLCSYIIFLRLLKLLEHLKTLSFFLVCLPPGLPWGYFFLWMGHTFLFLCILWFFVVVVVENRHLNLIAVVTLEIISPPPGLASNCCCCSCRVSLCWGSAWGESLGSSQISCEFVFFLGLMQWLSKFSYIMYVLLLTNVLIPKCLASKRGKRGDNPEAVPLNLLEAASASESQNNGGLLLCLHFCDQK